MKPTWLAASLCATTAVFIVLNGSAVMAADTEERDKPAEVQTDIVPEVNGGIVHNGEQTQPQEPEPPEKTGGPETFAPPEKIERPEKLERPERIERSGRSGRG